MRPNTPKNAGFTLVEIMIVVAVIGVVLAVALPNIASARTTAQRNSCILNLKLISGAKEMWALEQKKSAGAVVDTTGTFLGNFKNNTMPECPSGGAYTVNVVAKSPVCSFGSTAGHTF